MSDKIKVAIRVRKLIEREFSEKSSISWNVSNGNIYQIDSKTGKSKGDVYTFDHIFNQHSTNEDIFLKVVQPLVDAAVNGFNATIFAYGQTSSGKTYTMTGTKSDRGIVSLAISHMFNAMKSSSGREYLARASYLEIYQEKVHDLLESGKGFLKIREEDGRITVPSLKEELIASPEMVVSLLRKGEKIRRIGETNMNERSSRSHTIFRIIIESRVPDEGDAGAIQVSQLNLVDLAGSERADQSGTKGERFKEGCSINRSLFMLSHVISQLSEGQSQHINFRDSKLTRILQHSLGGNALTLIICTVTPAAIEQTHETLRFASRAKVVKNQPHLNEVLSDGTLLKKYARQLEKLKNELQTAKSYSQEVEAMETKLEEKEKTNAMLQARIDLLTQKLIVSGVGGTKIRDKRNRRMTWGGGGALQSSVFMFGKAPFLETIDENEASPRKSLFTGSLSDLSGQTQFQTPLEEFELQLMDAECEKSQESIWSLEENTPTEDSLYEESAKSEFLHIVQQEFFTFNEDPDFKDTSCQTENTLLLLDESLGTGTPRTVLRERISNAEDEYQSLKEFTSWEKNLLDALDEELSNTKKEFSGVISEKDAHLEAVQTNFKKKEEELSQVMEKQLLLEKKLIATEQKMHVLVSEKGGLEMQLEMAQSKHKERERELLDIVEEMQMNSKDVPRFDYKSYNDSQQHDILDTSQGITAYAEDVVKDNHELLEKITEKENIIKHMEQRIADLELEICVPDKNEYDEGNNKMLDTISQKNKTINDLLQQLSNMKHQNGQDVINAPEKGNCKMLDSIHREDEVLLNADQQSGDIETETIDTIVSPLYLENNKFAEIIADKDTIIDAMPQQMRHSESEMISSNKFQECNSQLLETITEKESVIKDLEQQITSLNLEMAEYVKQLEERKSNQLETIMEKEGVISNLEKEITTLTFQMAESVNKLEGSNLTLLETITEKDDFIRNLEQQITSLKFEMPESMNKFERSNLNLLETINEKEVVIKDLEQEITGLKLEMAEYVNKLEGNNSKLLETIVEKEIIIRDIENEVTSLKLEMAESVNKFEGRNLNPLETITEKESVIKDLEQEITGLKLEMAEYVKQLEERKSNQLETISDLEKEITTLTFQMAESVNKLEGSNLNLLETITEKDDFIRNLEQQITSLKFEMSESMNKFERSNLNLLETINVKEVVIKDLEQEITGLKLEMAEYVNKLEGNNSKLLETIVEKEIIIRDIEKEVTSLKLEMAESVNKFEGRNLNQLETITEKESVIKDLEQEITGLKLEMAEYVKQLEERKSNQLETIMEKEGVISDLEKEITTLTFQMAESVNKLEGSNLNLLETITEKDDFIRNLEQQITSLKFEMSESMNKFEGRNLNPLETITEKESVIKVLEQEITGLKLEMAEYVKQLEVRESNQLETISNLEKEITTLTFQMAESVNKLEGSNLNLLETITEKDDFIRNLEQQITSLKFEMSESMNKFERSNLNLLETINEKEVVIKDLEQEITGLKLEMAEYVNKLEGNNSKLLETIVEKEMIIRDIEKEVTSLKLEMAESVNKFEGRNLNPLETIMEKESVIKDLEQEITGLKLEMAEYVKQLEERKSNQLETIMEKEGVISDLEKEITTLTFQMAESVNKLEGNNSKLLETIVEKEIIIRDIEKELTSLKLEMAESVNKFEGRNLNLLETITEKESVIKDLEQEITGLKLEMAEYVKQLEERKSNQLETIMEKEGVISDLEKEITTLTFQMAESVNKLEGNNSKLLETIVEKEIIIRDIEKELTSLKLEMAESVNKFEGRNLNLLETITEKESVIKDLEQEIAGLKLEMAESVNKLEGNNSKLLETIVEKEIIIRDIEKELTSLKLEMAESVNKFEGRNLNLLETITEKESVIKDLEQEIAGLKLEMAEYVNKLEGNNSKLLETIVEKEIIIRDIEKEVTSLKLEMAESVNKFEGRNLNLLETITEKESVIKVLEQEINILKIETAESVNKLEGSNSNLLETIFDKEKIIMDLDQQITGLKVKIAENFEDPEGVTRKLLGNFTVIDNSVSCVALVKPLKSQNTFTELTAIKEELSRYRSENLCLHNEIAKLSDDLMTERSRCAQLDCLINEELDHLDNKFGMLESSVIGEHPSSTDGHISLSEVINYSLPLSQSEVCEASEETQGDSDILLNSSQGHKLEMSPSHGMSKLEFVPNERMNSLKSCINNVENENVDLCSSLNANQVIPEFRHAEVETEIGDFINEKQLLLNSLKTKIIHIQDLGTNICHSIERNREYELKIASLEKTVFQITQKSKSSAELITSLEHKNMQLVTSVNNKTDELENLFSVNEKLSYELTNVKENVGKLHIQLKEREHMLISMPSSHNIEFLNEENMKLSKNLDTMAQLNIKNNSDAELHIQSLLDEVNSLKEKNIAVQTILDEKLKQIGILEVDTYCKEEQLNSEIKHLKESLNDVEELNQLKHENITLHASLKEMRAHQKHLIAEICNLNSSYDLESLQKCQLSELLKMLLACIIEKETELIQHLQQQCEAQVIEKNDTVRQYEDREKLRKSWVMELEEEMVSLQKDLVDYKKIKVDLVTERDKIVTNSKWLQQANSDLEEKLCVAEKDLRVLQEDLHQLDIKLNEASMAVQPSGCNVQNLVNNKEKLLNEVRMRTMDLIIHNLNSHGVDKLRFLQLQQKVDEMEENCAGLSCTKNLESGSSGRYCLLEELQMNVKQLHTEISALTQKLKETESKNFELAQHIIDIERNLKNSEEKAKDLDDENENMLGYIRTLEKETNTKSLELLEQAESLQHLKDREKNCKSEIDVTIKKLQEVENKCIGLQLNLVQTENNLKEANKECSVLDEENNLMLAHIKLLEQEEMKKLSEIETLTQSIKVLESDKRALEDRISTLVHRLQEHKETSTKLQHSENLSGVTIRRRNKMAWGEEHQTLQSRNIELEQQVVDMKSQLHSLSLQNEGACNLANHLNRSDSEQRQKCEDLEKQVAVLSQQLKDRAAASLFHSNQIESSCKAHTEEIQKLKCGVVAYNAKVETLKLQIECEDFPYKKQAKDLEECFQSLKTKYSDLKMKLRHLRRVQETSFQNSCERCRQRCPAPSLHDQEVQTEIEGLLPFHVMCGGSGGHAVEYLNLKLKDRVRKLEKEKELIKSICHKRLQRIHVLEGRSSTEKNSPTPSPEAKEAWARFGREQENRDKENSSVSPAKRIDRTHKQPLAENVLLYK